jgi:hypothetical protein
MGWTRRPAPHGLLVSGPLSPRAAHASGDWFPQSRATPLHSTARRMPPESQPRRPDNAPPHHHLAATSSAHASTRLLALAVLSYVVPPRVSPVFPPLASHWRPWPVHLHHPVRTSSIRTRNYPDRLFLQDWPPRSPTHCMLSWRTGATLAAIAVLLHMHAQPFKPWSPDFVRTRLASIKLVPTFLHLPIVRAIATDR